MHAGLHTGLHMQCVSDVQHLGAFEARIVSPYLQHMSSTCPNIVWSSMMQQPNMTDGLLVVKPIASGLLPQLLMPKNQPTAATDGAGMM